MFDIQVV